MRTLAVLRKVQTLVSSALFLGCFAFFARTYDQSILNITLSYWGAFAQHAWLWNSVLVLLAVSILSNVLQYLQVHPRLRHRFDLALGFSVLCLCLAITGLISMQTNHPIHNISAAAYFFLFPILIFLLAHRNARNLPRWEWTGHIVFACCMLVLPILLVRTFTGMGIAESVHSFVALAWNIWILPKKRSGNK